MLTTTLNAIREAKPCGEGWEKLLKHLTKTGPDDEVLPVATILEANGVEDTLWVLARVLGRVGRALCATFAIDCAERVLHVWEASYPQDDRPRAALDAARSGDAARAHVASVTARAVKVVGVEDNVTAPGTTPTATGYRYARAAADAAGRAAADAATCAARAASNGAPTTRVAQAASDAALNAAVAASVAVYDATMADTSNALTRVRATASVAVVAHDERAWQSSHLLELIEAAE